MTLPPLKLTVPLAPLPAADTTRVSFSTSVSFRTTVTLPAVSSAVTSVSSTATGGSFTAVTVTDTVPVSVPPLPSLTV